MTNFKNKKLIIKSIFYIILTIMFVIFTPILQFKDKICLKIFKFLIIIKLLISFINFH